MQWTGHWTQDEMLLAAEAKNPKFPYLKVPSLPRRARAPEGGRCAVCHYGKKSPGHDPKTHQACPSLFSCPSNHLDGHLEELENHRTLKASRMIAKEFFDERVRALRDAKNKTNSLKRKDNEEKSNKQKQCTTALKESVLSQPYLAAIATQDPLQ